MAPAGSPGEREHGQVDQRDATADKRPATPADVVDSIDSNRKPSVIDTLVDQLNPNDGYRVRPFESAADDHIALWLEVYFAGELKTEHSRPLWQGKKTLADYGKRARFQAVFAAIARYLNCGGNIHDLSGILQFVEFQNLPSIKWPEELILLNTVQEVEETQHLFADLKTSQVLVWTEGVYVEVQDMGDLADYWDSEDDDPESDA